MADNLFALLDELRAIAQLGLNYSKDPYDRERYERLLRLSAEQYAPLAGLDPDDIAARLRRELDYITPKVGANGVVFNDQGQALLVQRSDNGRWGLPGGFCEVNATPHDNCKREVWEETGLEVEVGEFVGVFYTLPGDYGFTNTVYILVYLCHVIGGELTPSHETPIVGYYDWRTVTNWHSSHGERTARAYEKWLEKRPS